MASDSNGFTLGNTQGDTEENQLTSGAPLPGMSRTSSLQHVVQLCPCSELYNHVIASIRMRAFTPRLLRIASPGSPPAAKLVSRLATSLFAWTMPISLPAAMAQYVPAKPGWCGQGFSYRAGMCIPRTGPVNTYVPPLPGICASGYQFYAHVCVPKQGSINPYRPPKPGICAKGYVYSAEMCVPRPIASTPQSAESQ